MKTFAFYLFTLLTASSFGQMFSPQIDNYTYGDNQNWGIDVSENGLIFIANNRGLVRYTGQQWLLKELPKKTIIRSVFIDGDRIYTGSYEEFGYWVRNPKGIYEYTSLTSLFEDQNAIGSEEFWQILKFENDILFRSFGGLYIYNGLSIVKVANSQGVFSMANYDNKLLVATSDGGLQQLIRGKLESLDNLRALSLNKIKSLTSIDKKLFIYDEEHGGLLFDGTGFTEVPKSLNELLRTNILNKALFIDSETLAIGTIKNGVLLYNFKSNELTLINKELGLNNNTVLGLDFHNGNLWVSLDNGTSKINLKSSYRYYFDLSGDLGTVYDVAYYNDSYYLASNTGIYTFQDNKLSLIQESEGHVWNLTIINNQLLCGHNNGTYRIIDNKVEALDLTYGGVYGYTKIPNTQHSYLQSTYSGISHLKFDGDTPMVSKVEGIDTPINAITFITDKDIWATHPYKGIFKFTLNDTYSEIIHEERFYDAVNLKQYKTEIIKIGDSTYFYNSDKWYKNSGKGKEVAFEEIEKLEGLKAAGVEEAGSWFLDGKVARSLIFFDNSFTEQFRLTDFELFKHLVANYGKVVVKNDSIRMLNLNDGFATFNVHTIVEENLLKPIADKLYTSDKIFKIDSSSTLKIPYRDARNLVFETYTPNLFQNEMRYVLSGETDQSQIIKNGKFTLQNLAYGNYTVKIFNNYSKDSSGDIDNDFSQMISFTVLPPWYFSKLSFIFYFLLFIGLIYLIYRRNQFKIRKEQLLLKRQYTKETQERIYELEKANLEKQIKDKKRELTNSTASIIKKNEAIILLRNELTRLKDVSPNSYRTKKIIASSEKYINNKNDWKQFEENFKEFNTDFFDNLVKQFPKLTTRDLKLCAYIKTGLTSKEIAPLMNISKRGVELHRYRLRKKLKMESNDNFLNYLQSF